MTITAQSTLVVLGILVNITILVAAVVTVGRRARAWVTAIVAELNPPGDPGSTHEYAKAAADMSATSLQRFDELTGANREVRAIALEAIKAASDAGKAAAAAHRRIDDHLRRHAS